jgi:hypothetical protein
MKRIIIIISVLSAQSIFAQTPEFFLPIRFFVNENPNQNMLIYLGFDPAASDSLEGKNAYTSLKEGGEQMYPPPFQYDDARFTGYTIGRNYLGDGCPIDIRRKPDSASFMLSYEISITTKFETQSAHLTWNQNQIPAIIKHIILEPGTISPGPVRKKTDMKTVSRFDMPNRDSISKYSKTILTLYYNMDPLESVKQNSLDRSLTVYPNPLTLSGSFTFASPTSVDLQYSIIDITGKEIYHTAVGIVSGLMTIPLETSIFPASGAYFLQVRTKNNEGILTAHRLLHVVK